MERWLLLLSNLLSTDLPILALNDSPKLLPTGIKTFSAFQDNLRVNASQVEPGQEFLYPFIAFYITLST